MVRSVSHRLLGVASVSTVLTVLLAAASAEAQPTQPPPAAPPPVAPAAPVLTPPVLKKDDGAQYPKQALDAKVRAPVTVVLILEIDPTGAVTKATPEAPQGNGFDESAVDAGRKLVFAPATKNGQPIAAKIKYRIEFPVPKGKLSGRVFSRADDKPLGGAAVTVTGPDGQAHAATTGADGNWEVADLPFGRYDIAVQKDAFVASTTAEEVEPAAETRLTLRLEGVAPVAPVADAGAPKPKEEDIEEVNVRGVKPPREVTKRTFEQRELSRIPGTNGDALRAIQNFPGVARPPGLAGLLIVRGAAPNETNVFVDGTLIPLVYHFGGLSSVIPTEMLEKIDFYPGNFSSQYGRVTGGIVDVGVRAPKSDKLHGLAQADLIDTRLMAEGPIPFLGKGWSFAVAGRRSWFDTWLKPVLDAAGAGVTTAPVYYDYQAIVNKDFDKKQSVRFMFFGSDDRLALLVKRPNASEPTASGSASLGTAFYRFQARYKNRISDNTEVRVVAAAGKDAVEFNLGDNYFKLKTYPVSLRAEVSQKLGKGVTMNAGIDWLWAPYDVSVRLPPPPRPGEPPGGPFLARPPLVVDESGTSYRPAIYDEVELTPWPGGRIVSGVRVDYAKDTKKWDVSPRLVVRQDITRGFPRTTIKGGVGVFQQPPQPQETNAVFGVPGLSSNRAIHYSLGVEREFTKQFEASVEGFYRDLDNLVVQRVGNTGFGYSYGVETLLRYKPDAKFFGFIAYTLSRSVRQDSPSDPQRLFQFDQTHILTVLGSYRLGRGWEIGARFRLTSGSLTTPRQYGFFDENAGAYLPISYPTNGERLPVFHQLDVRVDKTWEFKAWKLSAYLDLLNSYNQGNVEGISYNYNSTLRTNGQSIPIIPSIGLRGEF
ncbi:MAG: TonB family protein [Polyangiaceae bacterium]|nr:TonB family protein [Polyangiaceae bacterium]